VGDKPVGAEQANAEVGKKAFGHYFNVLPGATNSMSVQYNTPKVIESDGNMRHYSLYIQKEAGTGAIPLNLTLKLPEKAQLVSVKVDGETNKTGLQVTADLREDRVIDVTYRMP
jgi:hypothetical protein